MAKNISMRSVNLQIRNSIINTVKRNPGINTRKIIDNLSKVYSEPKQRISGNLSTVVTKGHVKLLGTKPNTQAY